MKQLAEFSLQDGTTFLMEVEKKSNQAIEKVALPSGEILVKATQTFEDALEKVRSVSEVTLNKLKALNTPADEVEVKFGLKFSADAGAIFTTIGGEVNFEITLKWTAQSEK